MNCEKWYKKLLNKYDVVVVEKLNIKGLALDKTG